MTDTTSAAAVQIPAAGRAELRGRAAGGRRRPAGQRWELGRFGKLNVRHGKGA
jgi:hypothetical protein